MFMVSIINETAMGQYHYRPPGGGQLFDMKVVRSVSANLLCLVKGIVKYAIT